MDRKTFCLVAGIIFNLGGAVSSASNFCGLARHNRGLVGTEMGELGRPHRRRWPRYFRV
jgi:hypothetical protein